jgi:hypothetical protein
MFLQQLFSSTAASKGPGSEVKKQAAVGIGCIMMKVRWTTARRWQPGEFCPGFATLCHTHGFNVTVQTVTKTMPMFRK